VLQKPKNRKAAQTANRVNPSAETLKKDEMDAPDLSWPEQQKILVILAHPDDPEFFCGATLARWALAGHEIRYCLLTCGDKGTNDPELGPQELCKMRHAEQQAAGAHFGVTEIRWLNLPDGYLVPSLELRREIVRIIRQEQPDVVVTSDPQNLFPSSSYGLNHPDHRAAGQVVLDALFPAAGNHNYFPELLKEEGLAPHTPREAWISLTSQPNVTIDVTNNWEAKISAIKEHKSQIGDPAKLEERIRSRHTEDSTLENPRYEEKFRRLVFK
jgi:LmbE family N-acetylglucosaminyl deacetylase